MSVVWDGDVLSKIDAGKRGGKGNILIVQWIIDVNFKVASQNKFVESGRDMSERDDSWSIKTEYGCEQRDGGGGR